MKPQVVSYRKSKEFDNETFLDSLSHELNVQLNVQTNISGKLSNYSCQKIRKIHLPERI